jgi:hypothetical protein
MRGDPHHLFACQSQRNSSRGDTPTPSLADLPSPAQLVRSDSGKKRTERLRTRVRQGSGRPRAVLLPPPLPRCHQCDGAPLDRLSKVV